MLAARDFLKRHRSKQLLAAINDAYDDTPTEEEHELLDEMRDKHYKTVVGQW